MGILADRVAYQSQREAEEEKESQAWKNKVCAMALSLSRDFARDIPISSPNKPNPTRGSESIPAAGTLGEDIDLTDEAAGTAFEAVLSKQGWEQEGFKKTASNAVKRGNVQKENKAVLFLTAFAREIRKTHPDDCVFLAVNYFCTHAGAFVLESEVSSNDLLIAVDQQLEY